MPSGRRSLAVIMPRNSAVDALGVSARRRGVVEAQRAFSGRSGRASPPGAACSALHLFPAGLSPRLPASQRRTRPRLYQRLSPVTARTQLSAAPIDSNSEVARPPALSSASHDVGPLRYLSIRTVDSPRQALEFRRQLLATASHHGTITGGLPSPLATIADARYIDALDLPQTHTDLYLVLIDGMS